MDKRYRAPFENEVRDDRIEMFNYQVLPNDIQVYGKYSSMLYEKCIFCNSKCTTNLTPKSDAKAGVELSIRKKRVKFEERYHTVRACLYCLKKVRRYIEGSYIIAGVKKTLEHSERRPSTEHAFLHCIGGIHEDKCVHCGDEVSYTVRNFFPRGLNHLIMTSAVLCDQCFLARINLLQDNTAYDFYTRLKCDICSEYFPVVSDVMRQYKGNNLPKICDSCILEKLMVRQPVRAIIYPNCNECGEQLIIDRTIDIVSEDKKFFCKKCSEKNSETIVILKKGEHTLNIFIGRDSLTVIDKNTGSSKKTISNNILIDFYNVLSKYSEYEVTYSKITSKWK